MNYGTKPIKLLTNDELWAAIQSVADIYNFRFDKLSNPRKRHAKIFEKHPPIENPAFTQLVNELNSEYQLRNKTNA
jgi:hypothetical protein